MKETTIDGYIAREPDDSIICATVKPRRAYPYGEWDVDALYGDYFYLPEDLFPEIKFEDEPQKVKITITSINE